MCRKNRKISEDEYAVCADSRRDLGNFTTEELNEYMIKAHRRFYLRVSYLLSQIYRAFQRKNFKLLTNGSKIIIAFM